MLYTCLHLAWNEDLPHLLSKSFSKNCFTCSFKQNIILFPSETSDTISKTQFNIFCE